MLLEIKRTIVSTLNKYYHLVVKAKGGNERMLTMDQVNFIKKLEEYRGLSLREIAKITGHDFRTVKKYIDKENWNSTIETNKKSRSRLDEFKTVIDEWLIEELKAKRKQRQITIMIKLLNL